MYSGKSDGIHLGKAMDTRAWKKTYEANLHAPMIGLTAVVP